jgi:hypothetical protein
VLCDREKTLREVLKGPFLWTLAEDPAPGDGTSATKLGPGDSADLWSHDLREENLPPPSPERPEASWEIGTYGLDALLVMRPARAEKIEAGRERFDVLAAICSRRGWRMIQYRSAPPTPADLEHPPGQAIVGMGGGRGFGHEDGSINHWKVAGPTVDGTPEFWDKVDDGFESRPGQVNEWTIPLPDDLLKAVREALKPGAASKTR